MQKPSKIILIVFLLFIGDRFFYMPHRLNGVWEYETGIYIGDPISKIQNIDVLNNFQLKISKNEKSASFYLIGCYFGNLFLLEEENLKFARYIVH